MSEKDISRITVSGFAVGISGLKEAMEEVAGTHAAKSDGEVADSLLRKLEKKNYIPPSIRESYGKAFVREFRKYLGQPFTEEAPGRLDVKILGAGCAQCHQLTQAVIEVLTELNLPGGVEHVTDIREIARYGVMGTPALVINGKPAAVGKVPTRAQLKSMLAEADAALGGK